MEAETNSTEIQNENKEYIATKSSFSDLLASPIVKIIVGTGTSTRNFELHKCILGQNSQVFARMFDGDFAESTTGIATLLEDDPEAFATFATWIYRSTIDFDNNTELYMEKRIRLFAFAEKYAVVGLMDYVMDSMCKTVRDYAIPVELKHVEQGYKHTHEKSALRLYLARCLSRNIVEKEDKGSTQTSELFLTGPNAQEIIFDTFKSMRINEYNRAGWSGQRFHDPNLADKRDYHHHRICTSRSSGLAKAWDAGAEDGDESTDNVSSHFTSNDSIDHSGWSNWS